jgi:hypothetical protein
MHDVQRIAVVGSGIAGLASAWLLSQKHLVTLYEAGASYLGGHTNTVDVTVDGIEHPVDTGFLVYNRKTYPNLTALFAHLGVSQCRDRDVFSVSLEEPRNWSGPAAAWRPSSGRSAICCGVTSGACWPTSCVSTARAWPGSNSIQTTTAACVISWKPVATSPFAEWYLLPMAAAIWSCPAGQMLDYPLASFVRFCRNHGLLQVVRPTALANGPRRWPRICLQAGRWTGRHSPGDAGSPPAAPRSGLLSCTPTKVSSL